MKIKIENSDVTFSANVRSATIGGGGEQVLDIAFREKGELLFGYTLRGKDIDALIAEARKARK